MQRVSSFRFSTIYGETDISGKCGDRFVLACGVSIEIVGYRNNGGKYLVRLPNGSISIYSSLKKYERGLSGSRLN